MVRHAARQPHRVGRSVKMGLLSRLNKGQPNSSYSTLEHLLDNTTKDSLFEQPKHASFWKRLLLGMPSLDPYIVYVIPLIVPYNGQSYSM